MESESIHSIDERLSVEVHTVVRQSLYWIIHAVISLCIPQPMRPKILEFSHEITQILSYFNG